MSASYTGFVHLTLWDGRKIAIRTDQIIQWYERDPDDDEGDEKIKCVVEILCGREERDDEEDDFEIRVQEGFAEISMLIEGV